MIINPIGDAWSLMSLVAAAIGGLITIIIGLASVNDVRRGIHSKQEPSRAKRLCMPLAALFGALTPLTFLALDDSSQDMVIINAHTYFVCAPLLIAVISAGIVAAQSIKARLRQRSRKED